MSRDEARAMAAHQPPSASFLPFPADTAILPGLIDVHTHISELGRDWEGYRSATRAAAAGGITTLMGMPLNSIPATTSVESLELEVDAACGTSLMADVGLWGGAVPENTTSDEGLVQLSSLLDAGCFGLKAFLAPLPPSAGYETVTPEQLAKAAALAGGRNKPVLVHSELMTQEEQDILADEVYSVGDPRSFSTHVESRPAKWERDAVEVVCNLTDRCHMHVVHLSDAGCLDIIERTKERLSRGDTNTYGGLTVETCPHYMLFDLESLPDGDTRYKCFPPIRERANRVELMGRGLLGRKPLIDMVASDHSPCTPDLRSTNGDIRAAWGGLSGLQYQLQATATALDSCEDNLSDDQCRLSKISSWWSSAPSRLVPGMSSIKGRIDTGYQADLCAVDMSYLDPPSNYASEHHRHRGTTAYANMPLRGKILGTWLRGVKVYCGETDSFWDEQVGTGSIMLCT